MNKFISFVLLGALLLMCFSGCSIFGDKDNDGNDLQDNTNKSNDDGNSTGNINDDHHVNYIIVGSDPSGDPMSQYAVSVKIPEKYALSEVNIPVWVSYGLIDGTDVDRDSYTDIVLKAENEDGHKVILKTLNIEEILKPDYTVKCIWDDNRKWVVGCEYSYTETYTLPLSLFSGDSGRIYIVLDECNSADFDGLPGARAGILLHYVRNDATITISKESR